MDQQLRQRIEQHLRQEVCEQCRSTTPHQECAYKEEDFCPLFEHLDEIVQIVASIRDYSTEPYLQKLRDVVCPQCRQDAEGNCIDRQNGTCALDRFFPVVVRVIETELDRQTDQNKPG